MFNHETSGGLFSGNFHQSRRCFRVSSQMGQELFSVYDLGKVKDQMFQFYLSVNNMREFNIPHLPMH